MTFDARSTLRVGGEEHEIFRLDALSKVSGGRADRLPFSLKILLENLLRNEDGARLLTGWRAEALGDAVRSLVGGSAALGYDFLVSQAERAPIGVGIPLIASARRSGARSSRQSSPEPSDGTVTPSPCPEA